MKLTKVDAKPLDGVKGLTAAEWLTILQKLIELGWLIWGKAKAPNERAILTAVKRYQQWAGLEPDGYPGPVTQHHLDAPRICGTPDAVIGQATTCKWPHRGISWGVFSQLPGVGIAEFQAAAEWAIGRWAAVCNITPKMASGRVNIAMTVANLGGPGGVLADSQLPCGASPSAMMRQRYDSSELWYAGEGTPPAGRISLRAVVLHELGHALGIEHLSPNGPMAVMQPYYRPDVLDLLPPDIAQAVGRYGEPQPGGGGGGTAKTWRITVQSEQPPTVELVGGGIFQGR